MKPVLRESAVVRMELNVDRTDSADCPAGTRQSLVSKFPPPALVQRIGVRPIALQIARTRSSRSPYGGRIVLGVTPVMSLIAFLVQPSSAMICSFVKVVREGWDQV